MPGFCSEFSKGLIFTKSLTASFNLSTSNEIFSSLSMYWLMGVYIFFSVSKFNIVFSMIIKRSTENEPCLNCRSFLVRIEEIK